MSCQEPPAAAICVGHSRSGDQGAYSLGHVSEWDFNAPIANKTQEKLISLHGIRAVVVDFYMGQNYYGAIDWLADHLRRIDVGIAIEIHFNSAAPHARGYEYLYWYRSSIGRMLAQSLLGAHHEEFPNAVSRGIKPRDGNDRGARFLKKTHCPAVICEPFFGSNQNEWEYYSSHQDRLATVYSNAIAAFLNQV